MSSPSSSVTMAVASRLCGSVMGMMTVWMVVMNVHVVSNQVQEFIPVMSSKHPGHWLINTDDYLGFCVSVYIKNVGCFRCLADIIIPSDR